MSAPGEPSLHPLFLKLGARAVLVIGAGAVGERKILSLLAAGARVRVVAPEASPEVRGLARRGRIEWLAREFEAKDLDDVWLAFAATPVADVQRRAAAAAEARRVFLVAVDDPANASAYSGATIERGPFTIAISSGGATPALTRLVRELLEQFLPAEGWVEAATALRARWAADATPMADRFGELVRAFKEKA
jgi:siroheme synthase-like protein